MPRRVALLVAVDEYQASMWPLKRCVFDAHAFQEVLADPARGEFQNVGILENYDAARLKQGVAGMLAAASRDDVVLLAFAGHMGSDGDGRLQIMASDSDPANWANTTLSGDWLVDQLNACRSKRIVVVLDGCQSGLIEESVKGFSDFQTSNAAGLAGHGRIIMAAADSVGRAFERSPGHDAPHEAVPGSFTDVLRHGIATGDADIDADGVITAFELFEYAYNQTPQLFPTQTPTLSMFGGTPTSITVAYNPNGFLRAIPVSSDATRISDVLRALESESEAGRASALLALMDLTASNEASIRSQALVALYELGQDPNERIRSLARWRLTAGDNWWISDGSPTAVRFPLTGPIDWADIVELTKEITVNGDMTIISGNRDVKGNAIGRKNKTDYRELTNGEPMTSADEVRQAVESIAQQVDGSDLSLQDKALALPALLWLVEHHADTEQPEEAEEKLSTLHRVGGWVWDRVLTWTDGIPPALAGAWLFTLAQHIH